MIHACWGRRPALPACVFVLVSVLVSVSVAGSSAAPRLKWSYNAKGTLYPPPVVADFHPSPGQETLICDAEVRVLRCIDATGKQLWEYRGGWKKRLTSVPAVSMTARPGKPTILIGGSDGKLCCLDAVTGKELWSSRVGSITWGAATWADLDGDGRHEVVAGTQHSVIVLEIDGKERWAHRRAKGEPPLDIQSPLAACDIDGDGRAEIFGLDRCGPFCLNGDGKRRWRHLGGEGYAGAVVVVDSNRDGRPDLYCGVDNDPAVVAFDASSGRVRWAFPLLAGPSTLAVGDVNRDGVDEIVASDEKGHVHAIDHAGKLIWSFETATPAQAEVTLGDIDGDGDIETLVSCWDRYVYCLDSGGRLEWRYLADRRVLGPPTIADIDQDGRTDMLFGGSDHRLRCITLGGAYDPSLIPWPSWRFDAAQSGAAFPRAVTPSVSDIAETRSLLVDGGFEQIKNAEKASAYPKGSGLGERQAGLARGWHADPFASTGWQLDENVKRSGKRSVRVTAAMRLMSGSACVDRAVRSVDASVHGKGPGASAASLRWSGPQGVLREDTLKRIDQANGWQRFGSSRLNPPKGARWVSFVLVTGEKGAWWDDARISAEVRSPAKVEVLVNQVGYDVGAPKRFVVQSNYKAKKAVYRIVRDGGVVAHSGELAHRGRIKGHFGHDWGQEYWRGEFTPLDKPGRYRIKVVLDGISDESWPFEIGENLIWRKTARPAYRFFYYQRCGVEIPGYHGACHLDDGLTFKGKYYDLSGGWHDAGDYNTYHNAPYVLGLVRAYGIGKAAFDRQDVDGNGRSDFLDEIMWGGDHSRRMISPDGSAFGVITSGYGFWGPPELETDNKPSTGDERSVKPPGNGVDSSIHHAATAKIARYAKDKDEWVRAADRGLRWALANKKRGVHQFSTAVDLHAATGKKEYADLARKLLPKIVADEIVIDAIRGFDAAFGEDHSAEIRKVVVTWAENTLKVADNPFGVWTFGPVGRPNFFGTRPPGKDGWRVGTNHQLPRIAALVALAYQYKPDPRYLAFVYDQFNWILGGNPFDVSLMEGVGSTFVPTYHNRLMFGQADRGAIPGSVINGMTCREPGKDVPFLDMTGLDLPAFESNECWLPHNTNYLSALVNLRRANQATRR